jgi:hypothetical protein
MKKCFSIILISILISASLPFQTQAATPPHGSSPSQALSPSALNITTGAHIPPVADHYPGENLYGKDVLYFGKLTGKNIGVLMWFTVWTDFDPYLFNILEEAYKANGNTPLPVIMLSWQPADGACDQKYSGVIPFEDIANGRCDNYIRRFANALKSRNERFLLRFAHEMNIEGNPWWRNDPNWPALFVKTFRHVHDVLQSVGASNIELVWSPNYASNPPFDWNNIHNYYPGDQYVDWIGLSGYNWWDGTNRWDTFTTLYDVVLDDLACHYAKPQIIAEIGTVADKYNPQRKPEWILDAYKQARDYPFLRAIVWFDDFAIHNPNAEDFRVASTSTYPGGSVAPLPPPPSSPIWTDAYRQGISTFSSTLPSLSEATPYTTNCGGVKLQLNPSSLLITPGSSRTIQLVGSGYNQDQSVSWSLPSHFSGSMSSNTLHATSDAITLNIHVDNNTPLSSYSINVQVGSISLPLNVIVVDKIYVTNLPLIQR